MLGKFSPPDLTPEDVPRPHARIARLLVLSQGCFEEFHLAFLSSGGWSAKARRPEMNKKYVVTLTDAERRSLRGLVSMGKGGGSEVGARSDCAAKR